MNSSFFFQKQSSEQQHTHTPTGILDVQQLINGQAAWIKPSGQEKPHPKTLILNSPLLMRDAEVLVERLRDLQNKQFTIYYHVNNEFYSIKPLDGYLLSEIITKITPLPEKTLIEHAVNSLNLSVDELFILNQSQTEELCEGDNDDWAHLDSFQHIELIESNISSSTLKNLLQEKQEDIETLDLSGCTNLIKDFDLSGIQLNKLRVLTLNNRRISGYKDTDNLRQLIGAANQLQAIRLTECKNLTDALKDTLIPNLDSLELAHCRIDTETLRRLLSNAPNLRKLKLTSQSEITEALAGIQFHLLESLDLDGTNISTAVLRHLLIGSPELKTLSLRLNSADALKGIQFSRLESLKLKCTDISAAVLRHLLIGSPELKTLSLQWSSQPAGVLKGIQFSRLESINVINSCLDAEDLEHLFCNMPQLKTLKLNAPKRSLSDVLFKKAINLPHLKSLDLYEAHDVEILENLLGQIPQLSELNLSVTADLIGSFKNSINLPRIESFNLSCYQVNSEGVEHLLSHMPQLKTLDLSDFENRLTLKKAISLPCLELLNLLLIQIDVESLRRLIDNAPVLRTLCLGNVFIGSAEEAGCEDYDYRPHNEDYPLNSALKGIKFPNLEYLDASHAYINTGTLEYLLDGAPKLKILDLSNCCEEQLIYMFKKDIKLPCLELLELNNVAISAEVLEHLLSNSPTLEKLSFTLDRSADNPMIFGEINYSKIPARFQEQVHAYQKHTQSLPQNNIAYNKKYPDAAAYHSPTFPYPTRSAHPRITLDADVDFNPNKTIKVENIFEGWRAGYPALYRLQSFNQLNLNPNPCNVNQAFTLSSTPDLMLRPRMVHYYPFLSRDKWWPELNKNLYYGRHILPISDTWQPLPSLYHNEEICSYRTTPAIELEFQYSERDGLHYVRTPQKLIPQQLLQIEFLVCLPPITPPQLSKSDPILSNIFGIIKYCKNFHPPEQRLSPIPDQGKTGREYYELLWESQTGACRHRSVVFKQKMHEGHPDIPVRIIGNDCHMFVEIKYWGYWYSINLGGYPAKLDFQKRVLPLELNLGSAAVLEPSSDMHFQDNSQAMNQPEPSSGIYFQDKSKNMTQHASPKAYALHLLASNHTSTLIECKHSAQVSGLRELLRATCQSTGHPCFYIHSPDDLRCASPYLTLTESGQGIVREGPGGVLVDFLTQPASPGSPSPILLINYDNFTPSDLVQFNALLDDSREADGTPLPERLRIIGLMDIQKPGAYTGADFFSRFKSRDHCPFGDLALPPAQPWRVECAPDANAPRIDCYQGAHWRQHLLGEWQLHGNALQFKEGRLLRALKQGATAIELANAPWENDAFQAFWQQIMRQGFIEVHGRHYPLPVDFSIASTQGFAFHEEALPIRHAETPDQNALILNTHCFPSFLSHYRCDNAQKTLHWQPGFIEQAAQSPGKILPVFVSHPLSKAHWAQLLDACRENGVTLKITLELSLTLPKEIQARPEHLEQPPLVQPSIWSVQKSENLNYNAHKNKPIVIGSDDPEIVIHTLKQRLSPQTRILDVSELDAGDLITRIDADYIRAGEFRFTQRTSILTQCMNKCVPIILKGEFSEALQQQLTHFSHQRRQQGQAMAPLVLVARNQVKIPGSVVYQHNSTPQEKTAILGPVLINQALIKTNTLAQLKAMHRALSQRKAPQDAWRGLDALSLPNVAPDIQINHAEQATKQWQAQRMKAVTKALGKAPFVILTGLSGVGKTTFVQNTWAQQHPALFIGEHNLHAWAISDAPGIKTLFIDEANISSRQWSEFEGLWNTPPTILVQGQLITLSLEHKVIFAANPVQYGGERCIPRLFAQHGNTVVFDPLPPAVLYAKVLKPALQGLGEHICQAIAQPILDVAQQLTTYSQQALCFSPRELVSMALFTRLHYTPQYSLEHIRRIATQYAYELAEAFVPKAHQQHFKNNRQPKIKPTLGKLPELNDYRLTPTQEPALQALDDFLRLRQVRIKNPNVPTGGLGGLVLEGEPGIGKTEMVRKILLHYGITSGNHSEDPNCFYHMPVSMALAEKESLLLRAFHQGAVVVIDEINSAPMMERLMNALLCGKTPDGKPPAKPGFLVIGTQNPPSMAGRNILSPAMQHRVRTLKIPGYTRCEMLHVIQSKCNRVSQSKLENICDEYLEKREALNLCFRDLLTQVKHENKARKRKQPEDNSQDHFLQSTAACVEDAVINPAPSKRQLCRPSQGQPASAACSAATPHLFFNPNASDQLNSAKQKGNDWTPKHP